MSGDIEALERLKKFNYGEYCSIIDIAKSSIKDKKSIVDKYFNLENINNDTILSYACITGDEYFYNYAHKFKIEDYEDALFFSYKYNNMDIFEKLLLNSSSIDEFLTKLIIKRDDLKMYKRFNIDEINYVFKYKAKKILASLTLTVRMIIDNINNIKSVYIYEYVKHLLNEKYKKIILSNAYTKKNYKLYNHITGNKDFNPMF